MTSRARRPRAGAIALVLLCLVPASALAAPPRAPTVYKVPTKIKSDCSVAVDAKISSWLATVPDNSTVQFGNGRCYGQDGTIALSGRRGLTIDGQGSEFRALTPGNSHRANWRFTGGSNLTLRNMAVRGSNPTGVYQAGFEWQHGFAVEGVQGMTLSNVQARETWGDGVYVGHSVHTWACGDDASSARNVTVSGATIERIGRQGVAIVDAEDVAVQSSAIGPVAWWSVDIETDDDCEIARRITVAGNTFGANRYGVIGSVGYGVSPQVGDLTVTDNVQTVATGPAGECWAPVWVYSPVDAAGSVTGYRDNYVFRRNRFLGKRNGFEFRGVRNIEVSSNTLTLTPTTGCGKRYGTYLADVHTIGITSNVFAGANDVLIVRDPAGALSTGITSTGNSIPPLG